MPSTLRRSVTTSIPGSITVSRLPTPMYPSKARLREGSPSLLLTIGVMSFAVAADIAALRKYSVSGMAKSLEARRGGYRPLSRRSMPRSMAYISWNSITTAGPTVSASNLPRVLGLA